MVQKYITLNAFKENSIIIHAVQGESESRTLYIALVDSAGSPVDLTGKAVRFYAEKPDKTVVFADCSIEDAAAGKVSIALGYQAAAMKGTVNCTIYVNTSENEALKFTNLKIVIESSNVEMNVESSSEFSALVAALSAVQSFVPNTRKIADIPLQNDISKLELVKGLGVSNRNLLHNWDFRNPVNQRGLTVYPSGITGYTVDRWTKGTNVKLTLVSGGIKFENDTAVSGCGISTSQLIDNLFNSIAGQTVTLSAQETNGKVWSASVTLPTFAPATNTRYLLYITDSFSLQLNVTPTGTIMFVIGADRAGSSINLKAAKLELGSVSTLANDPPADYGEQLTLCQRYYRKYGSGLFGFVLDAQSVQLYMPFDQPMRITPTPILLNTAPQLYAPTTGDQTGSNSALTTYLNQKGILALTINGFAFSGNVGMPIRYNSTADLIALSADL